MVLSVAALVAAVAALFTVGFARSTVSEARKARQEARDAHDEEMQASERARHEVGEQHHAEMSHREHALDAEIALQRVVQMERVAETLAYLVDAARREAMEPPVDARRAVPDDSGPDGHGAVTRCAT